MNDERRAVWERYVSSWQATTVAQKRRLFTGCLTEHCTYTDPLQQAVGWDALLSYMVDFQRRVPGGHFITEAFWTHLHDRPRSLAKWRLVDADRVKLGEGMSYAEYDVDERLSAITGFFETEAPSSV